MRASRVLLIGWILLLATGCASTPAPPPPTVNVSGNWAGTWWTFEGAGGSGEMRGTFLQDGATVRGQFEVVGGPQINTTYVSGHVTGNEIRLSMPVSGTLVVNGDEMTGTVHGDAATRVSLRRQP